MTRPIPAQIVAAAMALAESLAGWCEDGRAGRLEEHKEAVLERVRRVLPTLVRAVVEQATSGLAPRVRTGRSACPRCGRPARPQQERSRQILTRGGPVTLERPWYHRGRCHRGWSVAETTLAVGSRQRASAGLPGWLARLGTTTDDREAAALLDERPGLAVGPETIRRECGRVGTAIRAAEAAAIEQSRRTREAAGPLDRAPGLPVLEADWANILYLDGWHEVKIGMVAGWDGDRLVAPSYVAARRTGPLRCPRRPHGLPVAAPRRPPDRLRRHRVRRRARRPATPEARRHALVRHRRRRHARPARPPALPPLDLNYRRESHPTVPVSGHFGRSVLRWGHATCSPHGACGAVPPHSPLPGAPTSASARRGAGPGSAATPVAWCRDGRAPGATPTRGARRRSQLRIARTGDDRWLTYESASTSAGPTPTPS